MPVNVLKRIGAAMQSIFGIRQRRIRRKVERLKRAVAMVDATEEQEIACEEAGRLMDQYAQMVMLGKDAAPRAMQGGICTDSCS